MIAFHLESPFSRELYMLYILVVSVKIEPAQNF